VRAAWPRRGRNTVVALGGVVTFMLFGCETVEYAVKEPFGIEKRDILVDRVEDAVVAQEDAKEQFENALKEFSAVTGFDGGDLEDLYDDLNDAFEDSEAKAEKVSDRVDSVERVAKALFKEWREELDQFTSQQKRADSAGSLKAAEARFSDLLTAMRKAESRMEPVLNAFRDEVLYLKHNLNAQAVAALQGELSNIERDVARLIREMEASIATSREFIKSIEG
jgi:SMC interacting uncharacterized protein involved in chromosome segregation